MTDIKSKLNYYSEWNATFTEIKQNYILDDYYELLVNGGLNDKKFSYSSFCSSLIDFVQDYLNYNFHIFNQNLNFYLNENNYNSVFYTIDDLLWRLHRVKFYEKLKFMDKNDKLKISKEVDRNINDFLSKLETYFYAMSYLSVFYSEIYYSITKMKRNIENGNI